MALFWEFFSLELKLRFKSVSTYVYFALWFCLAFLSIAAQDFLNTGNDKILLNGPFATSILYLMMSFFGMLVIAAIFGTSILRDFQRDTYQLIFTKPITKFAYLGGRWAGSFVTAIICFSGMVFGEALGTLAPWADHTRIAPGHLGWYLHPFLAITVVQIFFLGSLFFAVAALTRKLFVVYLQGVVVFLTYLVVNAVFAASGSLEHFWSAIFDPVGVRLLESVTRYWTVAEKIRCNCHGPESFSITGSSGVALDCSLSSPRTCSSPFPSRRSLPDRMGAEPLAIVTTIPLKPCPRVPW